MRLWLRAVARRLSSANMTATLALFIALGGTSYGLVITGGHIKDHSITGRDIRDHSLGSRQLKRSSIGGYAIKESLLGKVPRARRADTVGGFTVDQLRLHCPRGTRAVGDGCVELIGRAPDSYSNAKVQCESAGRRLPTHQQLTGLIDDPDVRLASGGELTSDVYPSSSDPGRLDVLFVKDEVGSVGLTPDTFAGHKAFRCVVARSN
jgi:hypothetical protein